MGLLVLQLSQKYAIPRYMNILEMRAKEVLTTAIQTLEIYEPSGMARTTIWAAVLKTLSAGNWENEQEIASRVRAEVESHPNEDPLFTAIVYGLAVQNEAFRTMLLLKLAKHVRTYELRPDDDVVTGRELLLSHSQS